MIAGKPLALARDASDLVGECYELIGRRAALARPPITGRTDAYQDLLLKVTPPRLPRNLVANRQAEQVDGEGMQALPVARSSGCVTSSTALTDTPTVQVIMKPPCRISGFWMDGDSGTENAKMNKAAVALVVPTSIISL